jgi:hypothetical protein
MNVVSKEYFIVPSEECMRAVLSHPGRNVAATSHCQIPFSGMSKLTRVFTGVLLDSLALDLPLGIPEVSRLPLLP